MSRLEWGVGPRLFERGVDRGVLYLADGAVPWNGLVAVNEEDTSSVDMTFYFDGLQKRITQETSNFKGSIEAFTYPEEFNEYDGYSERDLNKRFGFSYRTENGADGGYKIHLVYDAHIRAQPVAWRTIGATIDPSLFRWNIEGNAIPVPGARPASHLVLDSTFAPEVIDILADALYGTDTTEPYLPSPAELYEMYEAATMLRVTYLGDGTYTVEGPDNMLQVLPDGTFKINAPTAWLEDLGVFTVSSQ